MRAAVPESTICDAAVRRTEPRTVAAAPAARSAASPDELFNASFVAPRPAAPAALASASAMTMLRPSMACNVIVPAVASYVADTPVADEFALTTEAHALPVMFVVDASWFV